MESIELDVDRELKGFTYLKGSHHVPLQNNHTNKRGSLAARWAKHSNLALFTHQPPLKSQSPDLELKTESQSITILRNGFPKQLSALINASHDIFVSLHQNFPLQGPPQSMSQKPTPAFLDASRKYRSALYDCINDMEVSSLSSEDDLGELIDLLKVGAAAWHLCEIMILQSRSNLSHRIIMWIHEHCAAEKLQDIKEAVTQFSNSHSEAFDNSKFWSCVNALAMTGQGPQASQLLSIHPNRATFGTKESFDATQQLLRKMPVANPDGYVDDDEYWGEFKQWNHQCQQLLLKRDIKIDPNIHTLVRILSGEREVLLQNTTEWYELLGAELLLRPGQHNYRFETHMQRCIDAKGGDLSFFDELIKVIMEGDIANAVSKLTALQLPWVTAHLTDLMTLCGHLRIDIIPSFECSLREHFLLDYVTESATEPGFWQIAAQYLRYCPVYGETLLQNIIEREHPSSDFKAQKLISTCRKYHLVDEIKNIQLVRAMEWKRQGQWGSALYWYLEADDVDRVRALCNEILLRYVEEKDISAIDAVVDRLCDNPSILSSSVMNFLTTYRELLLVLDDLDIVQTSGDGSSIASVREIQECAANCFVRLLNCTQVPEHFLADLIEKILPFVAILPPVFSSKDTFQLMKSIEQIETSYRRDEIIAQLPLGLLQKFGAALTENLSNAIMIECSNASASLAPRTLASRSTLSLPARSY